MKASEYGEWRFDDEKIRTTLQKVRPNKIQFILFLEALLMISTLNRPAGFSLVSVVIAVLLLFTSLAFGTTDSSKLVPPGVSLNDTLFADIVVDNLTPVESFLYPSNYEVISERPYIIRVDYQEDQLISNYEAEQEALQFINEVFSNQSVQQLEIDRRVTRLDGFLPRWIIGFKNNTVSDGIHIEAWVTMNAITGAIIGYSGNPILCQGEIANQSTAEEYAATALKELGYYIPVNSRLVYTDNSQIYGTNYSRYYFTFQEVVNNTMIDGEIGSIHVELDGISGGIERLLYEWIPIVEIPTEGFASSNTIGYGAVLTLFRIPEGDYNEIGPQEFRLCWVKDDFSSGTTVLDAFNGEVLYVIDYLSTVHSQDEVRMSFLIPLLISAIPATVLYFGARKILRKQV